MVAKYRKGISVVIISYSYFTM